MQLAESMTEDILKKIQTQYLGHYIDPMKVLSEDLLNRSQTEYLFEAREEHEKDRDGHRQRPNIRYWTESEVLNERVYSHVTTGEAYHELVDAVHKAYGSDVKVIALQFSVDDTPLPGMGQGSVCPVYIAPMNIPEPGNKAYSSMHLLIAPVLGKTKAQLQQQQRCPRPHSTSGIGLLMLK
jgi:hypothetical protein